MGSLANKKIGDSFKDLLQMSNNNSGIDGTVRFVEDGEGTQSVLGLDTSKITIDGHILPTTNAAYDLGSAEKKIRHLYLSDNSLFVGDVQLSSTDASNVKDLGAGTYATTAAMNAGMATKADASAMTSALEDFYSKSDVDAKLNNYPTQTEVDSSIQNIIGSAPAALDTLAEIADALNDDANYAASVTTALATKADASALSNYATTSSLTYYLRSDTNDSFIGKLTAGGATSRSAGLYGVYDSYKISHIWGMGTNYTISSDGSDFGNLYGLAYKHTNNATGGSMAEGHQAVWCQSGVPYVALGTNIWAKFNITAYSDARVKKNIETIPDAIDKVKAIRGVTYDRTDTSNNVGKQMGVIAQELIDVIPEVVTGGPTDDDPDAHYSVAYGNIVGLLIEAIKEQQTQLDEQKQLINQLLNR